MSDTQSSSSTFRARQAEPAARTSSAQGATRRGFKAGLVVLLLTAVKCIGSTWLFPWWGSAFHALMPSLF